MMFEGQVIVHTGLHKTGTTFLQKEIYPNLQGVTYLGKMYARVGSFGDRKAEAWTDPALHGFLRLIKRPIGLRIGREEIARVERQISAFLNTMREPNVLLSHEAIGGVTQDFFSPVFDRNIEVLRKVFPQCRIFFVFRRQVEWFESFYFQVCVRKRFPLSIDQFAGRNGIFEGKGMDWYGQLSRYQQVFGKENVLGLPYEMLSENPSDFLRLFYSFFGLKTYYPSEFSYKNRKMTYGLTDAYPLVMRYEFLKNDCGFPPLKKLLLKASPTATSFLSRFSRPYDFSLAMFDDSGRDRLMSCYRESNRRLADNIGIDLAQYGYYNA